MHLNDEYEAIRGQILLLEPLPSVNKAYSMIKRVERQRQVTHTTTMSREVAACTNKVNVAELGEIDSVNALVARGKAKKDFKKSRVHKFCDHCQKSGHDKDQCFKLIGYPEWYDELKGKKKSFGPRLAANVASYAFDGSDTPLGTDFGHNIVKPSFDSSFIQALAQEVVKLTKGKQAHGHQSDARDSGFANFAGKNVFTGFSNICCATQHGQCATLVVDTGASDHMSYDDKLFNRLWEEM